MPMPRRSGRVDGDRLRLEIARTLTDVALFSRRALRRPLRPYQLAPAQAIVDAVLQRRGLTIAVMMSRQAGKNETAAQVEALLLNLFRQRGGCIVKAAPTFKPQALNSLMRLQDVLEGSVLPPPQVEAGGTVRLGRAMARFFSADPSANVVGATASILLEADEAQDVDEAKWDKDFRPMAASTSCRRIRLLTACGLKVGAALTMQPPRWRKRLSSSASTWAAVSFLPAWRLIMTAMVSPRRWSTASTMAWAGAT